MKDQADLCPADTVEILQTLGNPVRKSMVMALALRHAQLKFSELVKASMLNPNFDTGQFWHHLSMLVRRGIIIKDGDCYRLSQFGFKLSKILNTVERESSFLFIETRNEGGRMMGRFQIRKYADSDFDGVARLVKEMFHYYWVELLQGEEMSLEYARHAVATDLLVPGTYVYVAKDSERNNLVGFVNYYITHGGAFFLDYLWVKNSISKMDLGKLSLEKSRKMYANLEKIKTVFASERGTDCTENSS